MTAHSPFKRLTAFLALNFCLSLLICSFFLLFAGHHPLELLYVCLALVSNTVMLYAALGGLSSLLFLLPRGIWAAGILLGAFQLALVTDISVYKIFRFHLNSMVLNLVLTPGGLESLDQGWLTKALFAGAAAGVFALQWLFWRLAGRFASRVPSGRRLAALAGVLLLAVAADKGIFAWGTLYDSVYITRNARLFPLYQPLTVRSLASKYFGVKLDGEVSIKADLKYTGLDYPKAPLSADGRARPLNFLVIVVDSLRADMLDPQIMPETWSLAARGGRFANHYSGGNCTRFGIFSMFYGIYGNYWFPMLGERRGPVLMDVLLDRGYDVRLFASAKLSFPEFNKTCFVRVPREGIYDEPPPRDGAGRDRDISQRLESYLRSRKQGKPYFAFVFYDASHGSYDYPPGYDKFRPSEGLNPLLLTKDNFRPLFNKYKNSVHYDDSLIGGVLKAVKETGGFRDTVVLIAGDHGEPFFERGYYGHNQGYSPEEVRVPLVLYVPGRGALVEKKMTSHMDIPPTLLKLLGVGNPPSDYSSGTDLFSAGAGRKSVAVFSWDTAAIIREDGLIVMPLAAYKGGVKAYDAEYKEMGRPFAASFGPLMGEFQKEGRRFSR